MSSLSAPAPLIAITGELEREPGPRFTLRTRYSEAVARAGGVPVGLLPVAEEALEALLARVDGVVLSGGDDFDTEALGLGPTHPAAQPVPAEKQAFDLALARRVIARELPVLGICYGMQLLGLAEGARLYQHLPEDRPEGRAHAGGVVHRVVLEPGSKPARAVGVGSLDVVSRHHQALASVAAPWRVVGRDEEGLVEAIEREDRPFAVGVQWHPELGHPELGHPEPCDAGDAAASARLFDALVSAARAHAAQRTGTERQVVLR